MSIALGVDIGGSHITAGWVDLGKAVVLQDTVKRTLIDSGASVDTIVSGWCNLLQSSIQDKLHDNIKIGIAMPGPFDYAEGISLMKEQGKFKALYGLSVRQLLSQQLSMPPNHFQFLNDAESYLQGEVLGGAGKGFEHVLGLTLGTGLGSAIHSQGQTRDADLWKMLFKESIAEDYLSTRWFVKRHRELTGKEEAGLKEILLNGNTANLHQLFAEFAQNFCDFLVLLSETYHFTAVVLGGNISQAHAHFFPALKRLLSKQDINVSVRLGMLQEEGTLIGAACQWREGMPERRGICLTI
jgi:glucokinase